MLWMGDAFFVNLFYGGFLAIQTAAGVLFHRLKKGQIFPLGFTLFQGPPKHSGYALITLAVGPTLTLHVTPMRVQRSEDVGEDEPFNVEAP